MQKVIFKSAEFFLGDRTERQYILVSGSGGPLQMLKSLVAHTMVMPALNMVFNQYKSPDWPILVTQASTPGSGSIWGLVGVGLWTALLSLGLWGFFATKKYFKLRLVLGLFLLGQFALHSVYGEETFLYALHFIPLLILIAAFSLLTPARLVGLGLAVALIVCAGINNSLEFKRATNFLQTRTLSSAQIVERSQSSTQLWERGMNTILLAASSIRESPRMDSLRVLGAGKE